jgi:hypothetical protein
LLLAVVVHRRRTDDLYKDTDDIRENIINYEDEGGGEGDMTGYDLNVLRLMYDSGGQPVLGKEPVKAPLVGKCSEVSLPMTVTVSLSEFCFLSAPHSSRYFVQEFK